MPQRGERVRSELGTPAPVRMAVPLVIVLGTPVPSPAHRFTCVAKDLMGSASTATTPTPLLNMFPRASSQTLPMCPGGLT